MNNKYHLGLAAFIAVITSTTFIAGYQTAIYAISDERNECKIAYNKVLNFMEHQAKMDREGDIFTQYTVFKMRLKSLEDINTLPPEQAKGLLYNISIQSQSLECQLAKLSDFRLMSDAYETIKEAQELVDDHNKSLNKDASR